MRPRPSFLFALVALALFATACGDEGPVSGPGTLTAVLTSPYGDEGAAFIVLTGSGIEEVSAASATTEVFSRPLPSGVAVVVINEPGGELSFRVSLADTTRKPEVTIQEVAATSDTLRTSVAGYSVEFRR